MTETKIYLLPISCIPDSTLGMLSCLLNAEKLILSNGPNKQYRDWRGLACRINLSNEEASLIKQSSDKTARVMAMWMQKSPKATVGELLGHLEYIDRFDAHDDVLKQLEDAYEKGLLKGHKPNPEESNPTPPSGITGVSSADPSQPVTDHDQPGHAHVYDALVLHAQEDSDFVDEMLLRLNDEGFDVCTKNNLQAGHPTEYVPIATLIAERCRRVILVFSPDFFRSPSLVYCANLTQLASIESKQNKIYPIMYRKCDLPFNLYGYTKDIYEPNRSARFWLRLINSLRIGRLNESMPQENRVNSDRTPTAQPSTSRRTRLEEEPLLGAANYFTSAMFMPRNRTNTVFA